MLLDGWRVVRTATGGLAGGALSAQTVGGRREAANTSGKTEGSPSLCRPQPSQTNRRRRQQIASVASASWQNGRPPGPAGRPRVAIGRKQNIIINIQCMSERRQKIIQRAHQLNSTQANQPTTGHHESQPASLGARLAKTIDSLPEPWSALSAGRHVRPNPPTKDGVQNVQRAASERPGAAKTGAKNVLVVSLPLSPTEQQFVGPH